MSYQADLARWFAQLHAGAQPLLLPNPWDVGSARLLRELGFQALATTSSGFAATLGRLDGSVTRDEALAHAAALAAAHRPAGVGRPRERLRRRSRGRRRDRAAGDRGGPRRLLDRGLHRRSGRADVLHGACGGADRRGRRGGARRQGAPRPHRARREPHPRQPRPRRHDRAPARLRRGRRRRALRAGPDADRGHPPRRRRGRAPGQRAHRPGRPAGARARRRRRRADLGRRRPSRWRPIDAVARAARELREDGTYGVLARGSRGLGARAARVRGPEAEPEPR